MSRITGRPTLFVLISIIALLFLDTDQARANVDLLYFRAQSGTDSVTLEWETASELDNLGFNILRSESGDIDDAEVINPALIPSLVGGQPIGAYYEWLDENVVANVIYSYWLQDIDFNGGMVEHGPVEASITGGNAIPTLPPLNTAQPTETSTETPEATPSAIIVLTSPVEPTSTATPRNAVVPTHTPTTVLLAPTVVPVQPTQSEEVVQEPTEVALTAISANPTTQPSMSDPVVSSTEMRTTELEDQQATTIVVDTIAEQVTAVNDQGSSPYVVGGQPPSGVSAQTIGSENPQSIETDNSAIEGDRASASSSTLALIVLVAALLLALGGGITAWLILKPQTADQDHD